MGVVKVSKNIGTKILRLSQVFAAINFLVCSGLIFFNESADLPEIKIVAWIAVAVVISFFILLVGIIGRRAVLKYSGTKSVLSILVSLAAIIGIFFSLIGFYGYSSAILSGVYISPDDPRLLNSTDPIRRLELEWLVFDFADISVFLLYLLPAVVFPAFVYAILWALNPKKT